MTFFWKFQKISKQSPMKEIFALLFLIQLYVDLKIPEWSFHFMFGHPFVLFFEMTKIDRKLPSGRHFNMLKN